jgi:hypothetical protein
MSGHGMACLDIKAHHGMLAGMGKTGRPKAGLALTEEERAAVGAVGAVGAAARRAPARRRWRSGAGSCWPARTARTAGKSRPG